jgi:hypothetical protein
MDPRLRGDDRGGEECVKSAKVGMCERDVKRANTRFAPTGRELSNDWGRFWRRQSSRRMTKVQACRGL